MDGRPRRTASMSSVCSSRANGYEVVTWPTHFLSHIPLEIYDASSYFVRGVTIPGVPGTITLHGQSGLQLTERMSEMAVSTLQDDKKKALNLAIAQIEKSC